MARIVKNPDPVKVAFWRMHIKAWLRSDLSHREYCEKHGLARGSLNRWRRTIKYEDMAAERIAIARKRRSKRRDLRRNRGTEPETKGTVELITVPKQPGERRRFGEDFRRRIAEETCRTGMSVTIVSRLYGLDASVLYRWRNEFGLAAKPKATKFAPVSIVQAEEVCAEWPSAGAESLPASSPLIVEPAPTMIEIELTCGRKLRFGANADLCAVRRFVQAFEKATS